MPLVSVSAHDIDAAGLALDAELPPPWLETELADAALTAATPGHLSARLSRSGNDIVVRGRIRASLTTPCARCLDPAPIPIDTELSLLLQPAPSPKPAAKPKKMEPRPSGSGPSPRPSGSGPHRQRDRDDEYEFTSAEADVDTYDGETVILDPFVREAILLEVPNFPLCSEACPGIRPAAGPAQEEAAPPLDPRLSPLGALRAKLPAAAPEKKKKE